MKVGLLGEAPNDTGAIISLLKKNYPNLIFFELLKNIKTGDELSNQKTKTMLRLECSSKKPDIVLFIRDLVGFKTKKYRQKYLDRQGYYNEFKGCTHVKKTAFLLNIWEIESLIFADLQGFNQFYKCNCTYFGDVMKIKEPKEELFKYYRRYSNSDNAKIFELMDFQTVYNNCLFFKEFIDEFDTII